MSSHRRTIAGHFLSGTLTLASAWGTGALAREKEALDSQRDPARHEERLRLTVEK